MEEKADLLAMGTAAGTVLIYSTAKGALHCTLVSLGPYMLCKESLLCNLMQDEKCYVFLCIMSFVRVNIFLALHSLFSNIIGIVVYSC